MADSTPSEGKEQPESKDSRPEPTYTFGYIINMSGLDGCDKFIIAEGGTKFMPLEWPEWTKEYPDNSRVKFSYFILEDMMSTCMAQDHVIELTQIVTVDTAEGKCSQVVDPYKVDWMALLVHHLNPYSITKYAYEENHAYYLQCGPQNLLYHCSGYLICDVPGRSFNECARMISELGYGEVIWVRNE